MHQKQQLKYFENDPNPGFESVMNMGAWTMTFVVKLSSKT